MSECDELYRNPLKFVSSRIQPPSDEIKSRVSKLLSDYEAKSHVSIRDVINRIFNTSLESLGTLNGGPFLVKCKKASTQALKGENQVIFDYQIDASISFQIFSKNRNNPFTSPMDVAKALVANLPSNNLKIEIASKMPFINITLTKSLISQCLVSLLKRGIPKPDVKPRKVAIDYSSPNVAKDMHVGHLRSSVIGDSLSRVLEFCGHEVVRLNHIGDWGTQFGMLIAHLKKKYPDFCENPPNITDLTKLYKEAKVVFNEDEEFKHQSHVEVVKLQGGDAENLKIWKKLCDLSKLMFESVYKRLGIHPGLKVQGESFYNPLIPATLQDLASKGFITDENGAKLVWVKRDKKKKAPKKSEKKGKKSKTSEKEDTKKEEEEGNKKKGPPPGMMDVPLMAQKSDGGYGYDSTDLCAVQYRLETMKCDDVLYCVDAGQSLHFDLIFGAAKMAGWADPAKHRLEHVKFGVVTGEDGKRIKTRSGKSTRLVDLLDEGVLRAKEIMLRRLDTYMVTEKIESGSDYLACEKNESVYVDMDLPENKKSSASTYMAEHVESGRKGLVPIKLLRKGTCKIKREDVGGVASKLAHGCVKYFDLRMNRINNYAFSFDKMLDPRGDTNVYIQQQHSRIQSIFEKAEKMFGVKIEDIKKEVKSITLSTSEERAVASKILDFPDVLERVTVDLLPNAICSWLSSMCKSLSSMYAVVFVLSNDDGKMPDRLLLLEATAITMRKAMELIGIEPLYAM